ncbi:MAG: hypothetical protein IK151_04940 [Erysipelotrichaceae bacterium]|nr:hypothetical protein [Erysipelotrichaceae bacterium]
MKKKILIIIILSILLSITGCSGKETDKPEDNSGKIPSGNWVIRYFGDENGNYVEELNMTDTYYLGKFSYIEYNILTYGRMVYFILDENGKGTFTDSWDETQEVSFDQDKIVFADGYEAPYTRNGDFLWFQEEYQEYYSVMENVSDELLTKIKDGAFDCVELNKAKVGDLVALGTFDTWSYNEKTEPLKWRVLDKDGDNILILCEQLIDVFAYNTNPNQQDLDKVTWENSSLRKFLNDPDGFLLMFTDEEIARMQTTHLENKAANTELMKYWGDFVDDPNIDEIPNYSSMAVQDLPDDPDTDDKVFLLSFQEVEKYFGDASDTYQGSGGYPFDSMPYNPKWIAYITQAVEYDATVGFGMYDFNTYGGAWMTRTLSTDHHDEKMVTYITGQGQVYCYFTYIPMFIRPAMWIRTN